MENNYPTERTTLNTTLSGEVDAMDTSAHGSLDTLNSTVTTELGDEDALLPTLETDVETKTSDYETEFNASMEKTNIEVRGTIATLCDKHKKIGVSTCTRTDFDCTCA
jgi:hypothetical protein